VVLCLAEIHKAGAADLQTLITISICGDGLVQEPDEECDFGAGNNLGTYASSTSARVCAPGCNGWGPYCGDGILQVRFLEECDDGGHEEGDLCSATCIALTPVPPGGGGAPPVGSIPANPSAPPGVIPSQTETKVVVRGKAYPNRDVTILVDGVVKGTVRADSNANFLYSATDITPGTANFGFWAKDTNGVDSITISAVFEVVQSAVTTVANILIPPTISVSEKQVTPGSLLTISGQSVPNASISAAIYAKKETVLKADASPSGAWALQVDTGSLEQGFNTAKASFELTDATKSGFGRSISFLVGDGDAACSGSSDLNDDTKINLVDFSIFLISWGSDNARSDFNCDSTVNLADFSIMLFNWTG
jgi:cysteine-rich repeat protein